MKCSNCGAEGNGNFCPECGTLLTEQSVEQSQNKTAKKKKKPLYKRVWFWIVVGVILIGIIGGGGSKDSSGFSAGFDEGREAAMSKATTQPTEEPTVKPTATVAQEAAQSTTSDSVSESDNADMDTDGEFGTDINGNYGPDRIALITYAEMAMEDVLKQDVNFLWLGNSADDIQIDKTNLRYIITGKCKIDDTTYDAIIKLEFDETYKTYTMFQLKLDGKNIDF